MLNTLLLYLAAYGAAWVLVAAKILEEPREALLSKESSLFPFFLKKLKQLFSCIYCMSWWTGLIIFYSQGMNPIIGAFSTIAFTMLMDKVLYIPEEYEQEELEDA